MASRTIAPPQPDERQTDLFAWTSSPRVEPPAPVAVIEAPVVVEPEPEVQDEEPAPSETQRAILDEQLTPVAPGLFAAEDIEPWRREWQNMPEYEVADLKPKYQVLISFEYKSDVEEFGRRLGIQLTPRNGVRYTHSLWWPEQEQFHFVNKRWIDIGRYHGSDVPDIYTDERPRGEPADGEDVRAV